MPIIIDQFEFDALDDDLKALLCGSDQLRTEKEMAREIILNAIDPIIALGAPFRFEEREPNDFYISIDVPAPWAQVDLAIAWEVAQQDARACQLTLLYPHLTDAETQRDMAEIARGEGKKSPMQGQADAERQDTASKSMPLYWVCYQHNNQISIVIEPGASPIHARMRAALAGLDEGTFTEGHELDRKTAKQAPKAMIGRRLSQTEAKRLLAKFE
jgi:hypothetical protein